MFYFTLMICFVAAILLTPIVKKIAFKIGATDKPEQRKVHQGIMPRLGGLSIYLSFIIGVMIIHPSESFHIPILIGSFVIIITGMIDDIKDISAKYKLAGQIIAAFIVVIWGDMKVEFINLPFGGDLDFGPLSIPLTMLWIIGVTNAINLIDGLDGLAAGVSSIALLTIAGMAVVMGNTYVVLIALIVAVSSLGFLFYNFYPAKIFMGDVGSQFLGYIIGVLSLLGFKNITFISLIIPIIILGVPISDTFFAIIRRLINKQPISAPDKSHLHHCLLRSGFTHRQAVLLIYGMSIIFGLAAFIFSQATVWGSLIVIAVLLLVIELFVEQVGLVREDYKPLLNLIKGIKPLNLKSKG
ncbi:glycosyltransferase family 4 protein [Neobacillus citreus]|uniref:Undecaprenyl/decaprenyl-phosphate alpha-N-acetylglucosaminyl 1-phosphate transferase n=1 Tax=Neobacillus citreus TaxID=2833578 RepID=A0A942YA48_9BACI|nr:MraY family glycosyltransferase [Neobacillus citreus]MCH6266534.1 undecaprenyl/decaprenyl-phosphate alpha-N-acetylglucosaminyl 1-phosphate transferase [Neobacillus citreus]